MNEYSLLITTGNRIKEMWKFTVIAEDTREHVMSVILAAQKGGKYESPVELMDYVCNTFGWAWGPFNFTPDIEVDMNVKKEGQKKYELTVTETAVKKFVVVADSPEDACDFLEEKANMYLDMECDLENFSRDIQVSGEAAKNAKIDFFAD